MPRDGEAENLPVLKELIRSANDALGECKVLLNLASVAFEHVKKQWSRECLRWSAMDQGEDAIRIRINEACVMQDRLTCILAEITVIFNDEASVPNKTGIVDQALRFCEKTLQFLIKTYASTQFEKMSNLQHVKLRSNLESYRQLSRASDAPVRHDCGRSNIAVLFRLTATTDRGCLDAVPCIIL